MSACQERGGKAEAVGPWGRAELGTRTHDGAACCACGCRRASRAKPRPAPQPRPCSRVAAHCLQAHAAVARCGWRQVSWGFSSPKSTTACTRSRSWGRAGLGTRGAGTILRMPRSGPCVRVPSPERPHGLGLAAQPIECSSGCRRRAIAAGCAERPPQSVAPEVLFLKRRVGAWRSGRAMRGRGCTARPAGCDQVHARLPLPRRSAGRRAEIPARCLASPQAGLHHAVS